MLIAPATTTSSGHERHHGPDGRAGSRTAKIGVAFADIFTGLYGVIAVQAALAQRERTGEGQQIDMALLDCMTGVLANQALNFLVSGKAPRRLGNAHPNIAPYQVFPTSDGHLIVAVGNDRQFVKFCELLGRPDLAADARYRTNADRVQHRDSLTPELAAETAKYERDTLLESSKRQAFPAAPSTPSPTYSPIRRLFIGRCGWTRRIPVQRREHRRASERRSAFPAQPLRWTVACLGSGNIRRRCWRRSE